MQSLLLPAKIFQFLQGTVQTLNSNSVFGNVHEFQFLQGTVQTDNESDGIWQANTISIPPRYGTNFC